MLYELNPWTLGFVDADTEAAYRYDRFYKIIDPVRKLLIVATGMFILAWGFNVFIRAEQADVTHQVINELIFFNDILVYGLIPSCIVLYFATYIPIAHRMYQSSASILCIVLLVFCVGMVFSTADLTAQHYSFGFLLINTWAVYTVAQLRFLNASAMCIIAACVYTYLLFGRFDDPLAQSASYLFLLGVTNLLGPFVAYQLEKTARLEFAGRQLVAEHERQLEIEKEKSENLLLNILPESIAQRLKNKSERIADRFDAVTVLFADIAGFTEGSGTLPADELVGFLDDVFTQFDKVAQKYGLEKIKTIGDAYMVAGGVPVACDDHAERVAKFALEILDSVKGLTWPNGTPLTLRMGINTGPAVAGVIGQQKFIYDLWGDAVNVASRMESHGIIGEIQVSEPTYHLLKDNFTLEARGEVDVKGKGAMRTWLLRG